MLFRTFINMSSISRRAVGICLAAIMVCNSTPPLWAQARKLPRALLPGPGNVGIQLNLLGVRDNRAVVTAQQHPLFESSWMGHPDEVVAQTRYGPVTSQDLYLWMILRESPNRAYLFELHKKARFPKDREELAEGLRVEVDEFVFTNYIIPRLMQGAPADPVYDLKHHVYTLPAWQTVFLEKVVQPSVVIREADRVKYLQEHNPEIVAPQRLRVRYIFMAAPETAPIQEQDRVEVDMDELRTSILQGETDFASAARAHSHAPSASKGGEIPPFQHGELFFLFENAAAELEPGGVSRVFRGPRGFYMVQLIEVLEPEEPSLSNPVHARLVEEGLSRQVLKSAYDIYMRDMLLERRQIVEKLVAWDQLEDCEVLGEVCDFAISKGQFRSAWPGVEGNDLRLRFNLIAAQLRTILEREAMAQEVRDLGLGNDPLLERARWMSGNIIRRDAWVDQLRAALPISEELVRAFWSENPYLFTPMALKRVIRLTLTPSNTVPLPAQTRMELDKVLAQAAGQPLTVPVAKREELDEERDSIVYDTLMRTEAAFERMAEPPSGTNFYTDDFSTESLNSLMEMESLDVPSLEGEPAPGLEILPGPSAVTTDTLESLVDTPDSTPLLDLETTEPRGGQPPPPASGGFGPAAILPDVDRDDEGRINLDGPIMPVPPPAPVPVITPTPAVGTAANEAVPYEDEEDLVNRPFVPSSASPNVEPATRPRGGAVPVGITAPAVAPIAPLAPTPNIRKQQPPPDTSAIPYNPDWFYARLESTEIQKLIGQYASSDWLLSMDDLGFVYVPDLAEAPRRVDQVPVGAFSRPVVVGQKAISWYIEEARTVEKQPFEEIKTHAYDVYRDIQIDKSVSRTYNSELEKAGIKYKF